MKILQVTNFFKPSWESGGPARVAYEISKRLVERGHDVTVYTTDGFKTRLNVEKNKPINVDGIKIYYFRNLSSYLAREAIFPTPYYLPIIARSEIRENFDIIHIHEHRTIIASVVHNYAKKYNIPYLIQAHGSLFPLLQKRVLKNLCGQFLGNDVLCCASRAIALNKNEAEQYIKMGVEKDKIELVSNGVNLSEYEILPKKGEFKREFGLKNNEEIVLYAGRLHATKGIDLLIEAFADISSDLNNTKLVLLGPDDGFRSSLESLIQKLDLNDKVIFTGFVDSYEKKMAFVDANVFVTPQFSGFPITFLESCACGTPIITTNSRDELDWINDNVGYVVEYDKDRLRDAIAYILENEDVRERFGEKGKLLVKEVFSWDKIAEQIEEIYEECISKEARLRLS